MCTCIAAIYKPQTICDKLISVLCDCKIKPTNNNIKGNIILLFFSLYIAPFIYIVHVSLKMEQTLLSDCSVTKERTEVILEGTYNSSLGRNGEAADWLEIEFKCKPGATNRPLCIISPYHYRLDWLMWFAAFQVHMY